MAKQTNIRRRRRSWVVNIRVNGEKVWQSFPTRDAAELFLERVRAERRTGTYPGAGEGDVPGGRGELVRARGQRRRQAGAVESDDPARLPQRPRCAPAARVQRPVAA
jgi:hypothetical protein